MDPSEKSSDSSEEGRRSALVEVMMETEAGAGASGYSVVGGGERGIFIQEVLKDSPAAKQLSLQKGDQLLSARVYFDNVKYEDALKILQCAEPYKVSFFLKRTVPQIEVSGRPGAPNVELRGPKAKIQRMSVKSVKPFKAKKKRGGRFGLKRLKENKKARGVAEIDVQGSPSRLEFNPVDVEFAFPKFRLRNRGKASAEGSGQLESVITSGKKKRKIRFPRMKAKSTAGAVGGGTIDISTPEGEAEISGAKIKSKGKGPKFGMHFPQTKKSKIDSSDVTLKGPDGKFRPPSVEFDLSLPKGDVDAKGKVGGPEVKTDLDGSDTKMKMLKVKMPKIRLSRHSDEIDGDVTAKMEASEKAKLKMPTIDIAAPNVDVDLHIPKVTGTADFKDVETPDPNVKGMKMPDVDISLPKLPSLDTKLKSGDEIDGSMVKGPKFNIAMPSIDTSGMDMSLPSVDISIPKITGKGTDIETHANTGAKFDMPKLDISLPKISCPEGKVCVEGPDVKGKEFHMPSIDISLPKGNLKGDVSSETEGGKFQMPHVDLSLPKMKLPQGEVSVEGPEIKGGGKFSMPSVDLSLPKGKVEVEGKSAKEGKFKMPKVDVSLPTVKLPEGEIDVEGGDIRGGKFNMPSIDISLPKGKIEGDANLEGNANKGKFQMPQIDLSLPKVQLPSVDINVEGPELKGGKKGMPSKGNLDTKKGGKFKMPKFNIGLPQIKSGSGEISTEGPDVKPGKFQIPSVDISLPKGKAEGEIGLEGHSGKGGKKIELPKVDISLPKMKLPEGEINVEGPEIKGGKFHIPDIDISLPKGKAKGAAHIEGDAGKGGTFHMPQIDISLPKMKSPEVDVNIEGSKGGNINLPTVELSLPQGKVEGDVDAGLSGKGGKFEMPKFGVSLPKVKAPEIDISLPKFTLPEGEINIEDPDVKPGKFSLPSVDISLPKGKAEGEIHMPDISLPKGKVKGGADLKGDAGKGGFHMPQVDFSLPKMKSPEVDLNIEGPKGGKVNLPTVEISLPQGKVEGDLDAGLSGPEIKGGKFEMPKFGVSLPK
uniref:PDZ domain-containing protein n=1 Tax=Astyanax mexicanus TaxID=7994 RepID=A0A8B9L108_ASTMX